MEAIGYIRVSTEEQVEDGVSLDAQEAKIRGWAALHDHELTVVHQDAGISGATAAKRAGLQAAIEEACRRRTALVVYSLSRFARSTIEALLMSERLQRAGGDLVSLTEQIDTSTAAGKMVFRFLAALAEFERDQLAERTKAAMGHLRKQNRRISRHLPYGWDLAPCGTFLVKNNREQAVVDLLRRLRHAGLSYRRIAAKLEALGIPTKQGRARWSPKVIRDLVARERVAA